jgi:hypothetical protein
LVASSDSLPYRYRLNTPVLPPWADVWEEEYEQRLATYRADDVRNAMRDLAEDSEGP